MKQYIKSLDSLRACAIISVMLFHTGFLECGWIGVQTFFVLSGFLITSILLEMKDNLSFPDYIKKFYIRRALRIFPIYYLYLIFLSIVFLIFEFPKDFNSAWIFLYTYTYNLSGLIKELYHSHFFVHFWSLCVEEQFYLVWPLLIFILSKNQMKCCTVFLIFLGPFIRLLMGNIPPEISIENGNNVYWFPGSHLDAFAIGGSISIFHLVNKIKNIYPVVCWAIYFFLIIGLMNKISLQNYGVFVNDTTFGYPMDFMNNYQHVWSYSICNVLSAILIVYLIGKENSETNIRNVFLNRFFLFIGKISYGMYIFHNPIFIIYLKILNIEKIPLNLFGIFLLLVYSCIVILVSYFSFAFFELKFIKMKEKFR